MRPKHLVTVFFLLATTMLALPARAESSYSLPAGADRKGPVCFEVPSNYEITVAGKKLIGSAQARRKGGVLQHGALPLHGDMGRITAVLRYVDEEAQAEGRRRLLEHAINVQTALNRMVTWEEAANAFTAAFAETCGLELQPGELTPAELARADELVRLKYANPSWTLRV